jgi:hypothetical protein
MDRLMTVELTAIAGSSKSLEFAFLVMEICATFPASPRSWPPRMGLKQD